MEKKFCLNKYVFYILLLVVFVFSFLFLVNSINKNKLLIKSKANASRSITDCSKYGLFEVPTNFPERMKNYCKTLYKDKYQYGGGWGNKAKCYSKTKTCTSSLIYKLENFLICLNEQVDITNCINAGVAPANVLTQKAKCPPDGVIKYGWGPENKCYSIKSLSKTSSTGEPFCANQVVNDSYCCNAGLYKALKCSLPPTPTKSVIINKYCKPFKCKDTVSSDALDLTYYYMNGRYYSNDLCSKDYDITKKGIGNYCYGK